MAEYEQTDGFIPNQQTPPSTTVIGTSTDPFTSIVATTVSGTTVGAGSNMYVGGAPAAKIYRETGVDFVAATAKTITHSLNTLYPVVQVYGSGTNQQFGFDASGNVSQARITAISGTSVNAVSITVSATSPGSKVVIIG